MTYRETIPCCPMCAVDLEQKMVRATEDDKEEEIDVCPSCGAVWLDWFDGDAPALLAEHLREAFTRSLRELPTNPTTVAVKPDRLLCPICKTVLVEDRWLESNATVLHCRECSGMMIRSESFLTIVAFEPKDADPSPGPFSRFVAVIKALLSPTVT